MSPRPLKTILTSFAVIAIAAVAVALGAGTARASSNQSTILMDDGEFINKGTANSEARLDEARSLGVDIIKVIVNWREIAPHGQPANPADPASYAWGPYDQLVRDANARGMQVMFTLGGHAPDWASGRGPRPGVTRPDARKFGQFVRAAGTHYSGNDGVPAVRMWSLWNEPNLEYWVAPAFVHGIPYSPRIYRALLQAGDASLSATGHGTDTILIGDLAPIALGPARVHPLEFLRELACVDSSYRPYRGRSAQIRGCPTNGASPRLPGTGLAYHAYTFPKGPTTPMLSRDDAAIGQLPRVTSTLSKLRSRFRSNRSLPLYLTEFGCETNPPDRYRGVPLSKVPGFLGESEWLAYTQSNVASYAQYSLVDDALGGVGNGSGFGGFQSGLRFGPDAAHFGQQPLGEKPGAYEAFRSPFFVRYLSSGSVDVWGGARPLISGTVQVQQRLGRGAWANLGAPIAVNGRGYFDQTFRLSHVSSRTFRFSYTDTDSDGVTTHLRQSAALPAVRP